VAAPPSAPIAAGSVSPVEAPLPPPVGSRPQGPPERARVSVFPPQSRPAAEAHTVPVRPLPPLPAGPAGLEEAKRRVHRVMKIDPPPPIVADARTPMAAASVGGVFYNPNFFRHVHRDGGDSAVIGILAHELGHIRRGHVFLPKSTPQVNRQRELEADQEAGCALANLKMNASGYHDLTVRLSGPGSQTHPGGAERSRAIAYGHRYCWRGPGRKELGGRMVASADPYRRGGPTRRGPMGPPGYGAPGYRGAPGYGRLPAFGGYGRGYGPPPGPGMLYPRPPGSYGGPPAFGSFATDPFAQPFDTQLVPQAWREAGE
jgi:hypothetical protein